MTDSGNEVKYDKENKPAVSNLLIIYSLLSGEKIQHLEKKYHGKGYGDFKKDLAEVVGKFLSDFQKKYNKISDKDVENILKKGAEKVGKIAAATMNEVKAKIGINI
jgi:tryptophanyl-tRNA synthetase